MSVFMSGKPFVAEACNIGLRQKSQPITLDATLCPALMCDIVSIFNVPIKTSLALHIWPIRRTVRLAIRHFFCVFDGHVDLTTHTAGRPASRPAHRPARPDMQVRRRFLSHTNVACLCDKRFAGHENAHRKRTM
jgi:hypothetical protein